MKNREKKEAGSRPSLIKDEHPSKISSKYPYDNYNISFIEWDKVIVQNYRNPENIILVKTRLINEIFQGRNSNFYNEDENKYKGKFEPFYNCEIDFEISSEPLNHFDLIVFWCICSITEAGNNSFTVKQVSKLMGFKRPSKTTLNKINKSIERLSDSVINNLNYRDHFLSIKENRIIDYNSFQNKPILPLEEVVMELKNGFITDGYKLTGAIPLLEYSKSVRQIGSLSSKIFNKLTNVSHTEEIVLLYFYLMWYLDFVLFKRKDKIKVDVFLRIDRLIQASGINFEGMSENTAKTKRKRWIENLRKILDDLVGFKIHNHKFVKYEFIKKGRKFERIKLIFEGS